MSASEADDLTDEDDVDTAGRLLVDLQDLADRAVLAIGGIRPSVFELQAVLVDALTRRFGGGDELLPPDHEDDVGRAPRIGGELAADADAMTSVPSWVTAWTLPSA